MKIGRIMLVLLMVFVSCVLLGACKKKKTLRIHECEVTGSVIRLDHNTTYKVYKYRDLVTGETGEMNGIHNPLSVGDHFEKEVWVPVVRER